MEIQEYIAVLNSSLNERFVYSSGLMFSVHYVKSSIEFLISDYKLHREK